MLNIKGKELSLMSKTTIHYLKHNVVMYHRIYHKFNGHILCQFGNLVFDIPVMKSDGGKVFDFNSSNAIYLLLILIMFLSTA